MTLNTPSVRYADIPDVLAAEVVGFSGSPEFAQEADWSPFPGIVLAALARYLHRMKVEGDRGPELASGLHAVEQLAQRGDPDTRNAVVTEFLHSVANEPDILLADLGPMTQRLYQRWLSDQ
jgi:hypothetical protein